MTVEVGSVLKVVIEHQLEDGTIVQNVPYWKLIAVAGYPDATIVTAIENHINGAYNFMEQYVNDQVLPKLSTVDVVEWTGALWEVVQNVGVFTPSFAPTNVNHQLPNQCSPFVVFETERPKTKGRKFLWGTTEAQQVGSVIASALVTAIVSWADDMLSDITLGVLEYLVPGVPRSGFDVWYPFTAAVVTNIIGSQRRRRPGVGI